MLCTSIRYAKKKGKILNNQIPKADIVEMDIVDIFRCHIFDKMLTCLPFFQQK